MILASMYIVCFYLPLVWTLFRKNVPNSKLNPWIEYPIYTVGIMIQIIFFTIELIQIRYRWKTYLKDSIWNWIEFTQIFLYILYVYEEITHEKNNESLTRRLSAGNEIDYALEFGHRQL